MLKLTLQLHTVPRRLLQMDILRHNGSVWVFKAAWCHTAPSVTSVQLKGVQTNLCSLLLQDEERHA